MEHIYHLGTILHALYMELVFYKGKSYHTPTHTQTCPLILCTLHTPHPHTPAKFISPSGGPGDNVGEPYAIVQALCILLVGQFPWHQP